MFSTRKTKTVFLYSTIFIVAFGLNLFWELSQRGLYTNSLGPLDSFSACFFAALADAAAILFILILAKRLFKKHETFFILAAGVFVSLLVEKISLTFGFWSYETQMPIIPILKTGLTPTIQLALTGYLCHLINKGFNQNKKSTPKKKGHSSTKRKLPK